MVYGCDTRSTQLLFATSIERGIQDCQIFNRKWLSHLPMKEKTLSSHWSQANLRGTFFDSRVHWQMAQPFAVQNLNYEYKRGSWFLFTRFTQVPVFSRSTFRSIHTFLRCAQKLQSNDRILLLGRKSKNLMNLQKLRIMMMIITIKNTKMTKTMTIMTTIRVTIMSLIPLDNFNNLSLIGLLLRGSCRSRVFGCVGCYKPNERLYHS